MRMTATQAPTARRTGRRIRVALAILSTVVVALYCWTRLDRGWVPHDEGTIAQSAERVLRGQIPHHDFTDVYTGGLSYLHAGALQLFGVHLLASREALFILLIGWVPALYYCLTRFVGPLAGAGLVLLAAAWSFPVYPAALPSWYILFLSTIGVAALLRHIEDPRPRYLVLAGLAGGFAILAKVSGLFFVAAGVLSLVYREQVEREDRTAGKKSYRSWLALLTAGLLLLVAALILLVRSHWTFGMMLHFVLPAAALGAMMLVTEWSAPQRPVRESAKALLATILPFLTGVMIPLALFALPYLLRGQFGELIFGVFILPSRRIQFAALPPPGLRTLLAALPLAPLLFPWRALAGRRQWLNLGFVAAVLVAILVGSRDIAGLYAVTWLSLRSLGPIAVIAGAFLLARGRADAVRAPADRERVALVMWTAALMSLLQFPFAAPIYYCYVAPFILLAVVAIRPVNARVPLAAPALVVAFYTAFAVWLVHPGTVYTHGRVYEADRQTEPLRLVRGGLRVTREEQAVYERVVSLVQEHAKNGVVLATPDSPEIAFLSDRANPTRSLFEFFDAPLTAPAMMALLDQRRVTAVVVNNKPWFSPRLAPDVLAALHLRFPSEEVVGPFLVLW